MLDFERMEFKNILSYGNALITYIFEKGITRISGENGVGKSTIVDVFWFALFGKTYRKIKLEQLINSINKKDLDVKLYFRIKKDQFRIERGLKPNFLKIFKNDILVPMDSKKTSYQEMLEEEILCLNENIANQILIKSLTKNISFLSLTKAEKRQIVEGIFDIEIFSDMNKLCKAKVDALELEIRSHSKDIEKFKMLYEQELENIEKIKRLNIEIEEENKKFLKQNDERIVELNAENETYRIGLQKINKYKERLEEQSTLKNNKKTNILKLRESISEYTTNITSLRKNISDKKTEISAFNLSISELKMSITAVRDREKRLRDMCSDCPRIKDIIGEFDFEAVNQSIKKLEEQRSVKEEEIKIVDREIETTEAKTKAIEKDSIVKIEDEIKEIDKTIKKFEEFIYNENFLNTNIKKNDTLIKELQQKKELRKKIEIDETNFKAFKSQRIESETKMNETSFKKKHFSVMRILLADEGIKTFVIKKHLPSINKLLNTYLQKFSSEILFYFDAEFNEIIGTRHKEGFNYFSFSEGQKRRIDLSILFSFSEFSKIKNKKSSCNVMILDEITAGCDATAENSLYDILREIVRKEEKEIITISHSLAIDPEKIDRQYMTTLNKGFSELKRIG